MKTLIYILIIAVLVFLFGSVPLSVLSKIFEYIGIGFKWLAKGLNIFGWNGML